MGFVKTLEEAAENYRENAEFYDAEVLTVYFETKAEIVEKTQENRSENRVGPG
ncbi:MAG: hypothetical protein QNK40_07015 [Desulfobacterales bacterium]|nr:hypothetical protein [Desulfobacterales bacterium]